MENLTSVQFMDVPRLVSDGYGTMLLLGNALRNATRSPADETRDAGMVVPSYPVLVSGSKATVTASRYVGDDVIIESRGDRSVVVGMAGAVGALMSSPILPLAAAAGAGVGVFQARQEAAMMQAWEAEMEAMEYEESDGDF